MNVLILGVTGMLGSTVFQEMIKYYGKNHVVGTHRGPNWDKPKEIEGKYEVFYPGHVGKHWWTFPNWPLKFDYVINCIGTIIPNIDKNDVKSVENAIKINSIFPRRLAAVCEKEGVKLIHISSDCVFSGKTGYYDEQDTPDPTCVYGQSKAMGEPENCMTLRASIIGEEINHKYSLVEWLKSQDGKEVQGYMHHRWNGITTKQYAKICQQIIDKKLYKNGLYHVFSPVSVTKCELLEILKERLALTVQITPISEGEGKTIDRTLSTVHNLNSILNISNIKQQIQEM